MEVREGRGGLDLYGWEICMVCMNTAQRSHSILICYSIEVTRVGQRVFLKIALCLFMQ